MIAYIHEITQNSTVNGPFERTVIQEMKKNSIINIPLLKKRPENDSFMPIKSKAAIQQ